MDVSSDSASRSCINVALFFVYPSFAALSMAHFCSRGSARAVELQVGTRSARTNSTGASRVHCQLLSADSGKLPRLESSVRRLTRVLPFFSRQDKFGQVMGQLPQLRLLTTRGEEFLYFKHLSGSAPTQTLLMEMLHAKRK